MSSRMDKLLNGGAILQPPPQTQQMVLATPFNDTQLLAMVASNLPLMPADAVDAAIEIVAQAVVKIPTLQARIRSLLSPTPASDG